MLFEGNISTLEQLLYPMKLDSFAHYYANQEPVFIRGGSSTRVTNLITADQVSELVQQGLHPDGRIKLYKEGKQIPWQNYCTRDSKPRVNPSLLRRILNGGASLVVNGIDELHRGIGDLCHALELELSSDVWANAYITVKHGGAFNVHFDDHDVLALQISGSKRWRLFGKTEEFPLHPGEQLGEPPSVEQQNDVIEPGEVLFIPRGVWHCAEVVAGPSFHITFGVRGETAIDLIKTGLDELQKAALFRKYIPRIGGDQLLRSHEEEIKAYLHNWVDDLSFDLFLYLVDSARRNRSQVALWDPISISGASKLWVTSRRLLPAQLLEANRCNAIRLGGETYDLPSMEMLVLRIAFKRIALSFDELVAEVRQSGTIVPDADLQSAVVQLIEFGLLNAEGH